MGVMTAMYAIEPELVAPTVSRSNGSEQMNYNNAYQDCKKRDSRLPNIDELTSIWYNYNVLNMTLSGVNIRPSMSAAYVDGENYKSVWCYHFNNAYQIICAATNDLNNRLHVCVKK